ncbi:MAG: MgtC/SapB family protein [Clostridia bacterium]|nr:MgtC/SapB family protein [Clostridia bacterium]
MELTYIFRLFLAVLLGFAIGYERKRRYKEAGIRTHTIVCLGSALMMVVSIFGFGGQADAARVAAQIVSGVGFLGAGIIVYRKHETKGLTTAAGVWATAGVGMACGGGLYILAVAATILMISAQVLFHTKFKIFKHKLKFTIEIVFYQTDDENTLIKKEFGVDRLNSLLITRQGERLIYSATLLTEREHRSAELTKIMQDYPFIISLRRCDD